MRKLKNRNSPGLFLEFFDPDTDYHFNSLYPSFDHLVNHVKAYRMVNKLEEIPNIEVLIDLFLADLVENVEFSEEITSPDPIPLNIRDYAKGANAFLTTMKKRLLHQEYKVSRITASKRQAKCAFCPFNTGGLKDHNIAENLVRKIGSGVIKEKDDAPVYQNHMGQCTICHCDLSKKTHALASVVDRSLSSYEKMQLPRGDAKNILGERFNCWQLLEELRKEPEYDL